MLSFSKASVLLAAALGLQMSTVSALMATQLTGGEMEALETILSYMALLALGIIGTFIGFLRYFFSKFNPKNLDPVTVLMVERFMKESGAGPMVERMEKLEAELARRGDMDKAIIDMLSEVKAGVRNQNMGAGELYLRTKESKSD